MDSQNKILGKCKQNIVSGLVLLLDKVELKEVKHQVRSCCDA